MSIRIISPGALTTVQDMGVRGQAKNGFPSGGVMDAASAASANRLCGNDDGAAVIEMTLFGITAEFLDDTVFAICGADMQPKLDDSIVPVNTTLRAARGQVLTLTSAVSGCRAYLAAVGGFTVPDVLGSRSTLLKCGIGGFEGRKLRAGDIIPCAAAAATPAIKHFDYTPYGDLITLRAVAGPQADRFTRAGLRTFFSSEYAVTQQSDRMGIRLTGAKPEAAAATDIVSDGIVFGSVQIPSGGEPIILMADRQTTGGYAKIATVITADLPQAAQAVPGTKIRFSQVTVSEARAALREARAKLI